MQITSSALNNESHDTCHSVRIRLFHSPKKVGEGWVTQIPSPFLGAQGIISYKTSVSELGNPQLVFNGRSVWIHQGTM